MAELGYLEGNNFTYDHVQIPSAEAWESVYREVVARKPDMVLAAGPELSLKSALARAAGKLIAVDYDPIARGYITSLARPTGTITGVYFQSTERGQAPGDAEGRIPGHDNNDCVLGSVVGRSLGSPASRGAPVWGPADLRRVPRATLRLRAGHR